MSFTREKIRHPLAVRYAQVVAVRDVVPTIKRVTLRSHSLFGFTSLGPADHVKVFFPDPVTGRLTAPTATEDGLQRPSTGIMISRDYTPLAYRPGGRKGWPELDIDFVVHGDNGPASAWASRVQPGIDSELAIVGPRGSRLLPEGMKKLVLIADETALPAASRWLEMTPKKVPITAIFDVQDESIEDYFDETQSQRASMEWLYRRDGYGQLEEAVRSLGKLDDETFVFMAGEAGTLAPVRRHLRRELGLPKEQVVATGYWKRGIVNLDHHAPVDPTDPD